MLVRCGVRVLEYTRADEQQQHEAHRDAENNHIALRRKKWLEVQRMRVQRAKEHTMAGLRVYCAGPSMGLAVSVARGATLVVVVAGGATSGCKKKGDEMQNKETEENPARDITTGPAHTCTHSPPVQLRCIPPRLTRFSMLSTQVGARRHVGLELVPSEHMY